MNQQTRGQHVKRHDAKWRLTRLLYQRAWGKHKIIDLFQVIDWMMDIAPELELALMRDIENLEREREMPYINPFERRGLERGRQEGRQEALREMIADLPSKRFGALPQSISHRLQHASPAELRKWGIAALDAPTLDSVFIQI